MSTPHLSRLGLGLVLAGTIGCHDSSGPAGASAATHPVDFRIAVPGGHSSTSGAGPLQIASLQLVLGPAALGNGDQFGCQDCQDNGNNEADPGVQLASVPTDGSPVSVATEQVTAGRYSAAEIELARPDATILSSHPGWPSDASIEVAGTFNSTPFTVTLPLEGSFREVLDPAVEVGTGTPAAVDVTITLPVSSWFGASAAPLNPNDPAQLAQIEQNAKASLDPPESESGESETGGEADERAGSR